MHDALTIEVPEDRAEYLRPIVEERLTARYDHIPGVTFTTKTKICIDWAEFKWSNSIDFEKAVRKAIAECDELTLAEESARLPQLVYSSANQYEPEARESMWALGKITNKIIAERKRLADEKKAA